MEDMLKFEIMIGKFGDGFSLYVVLVDEYYEYDDDYMVDVMEIGMGVCEQFLLLIIMMVGINFFGLCFEMWSDVICILCSEVIDEIVFVVIYCFDEGDCWDDFEVL